MDGNYIYWSSHDFVSGQVTVLASGVPAGSVYDVFVPNGVAVDSTYVYWGEAVGGGAVRRVPKAGGTVVDINRGGGLVVGVAVDSPSAPTRTI